MKLTKKTLALLITVSIASCAKLDTQNRTDAAAPNIVEGTKQLDLKRYRTPLNIVSIDRRFTTIDAMYLANELEIGSFEFLMKAAAAGIPVDNDFVHMTTKEAYWYSRYNMSALTTESRLGVGVIFSPYISEYALRKGNSAINRDRGEYVRSNKGVFLQDIIPSYLQQTGFPRRFEDASPVMLHFESGDPHYIRPLDKNGAFESEENLARNEQLKKLYGEDQPELIYGIGNSPTKNWKYRVNYRENFLSLRWNEDKMDKVINLGAEGQALMKMVLWSEFFFGGKNTGNKYLGITPEDGFRGAMLNLMAVSKMLMLKSSLAYDGEKLTGFDPRSAKPGQYYFPHRVGVKLRKVGDAMPRPEQFEVIDSSSHLFDQASLLWGLTEYYHYSNPANKSAWNAVFGENTPYDGSLMEQKYTVLAQALADTLVNNIYAMHRKSPANYVSIHTDDNSVSARDLGMSMVALANYISRVKVSDDMHKKATEMLNEMASLLTHKLQHTSGAISATTANATANSYKLEAQGFAIRGLLEAYRVTKDTTLLSAAERIFDYMNASLWVDNVGLYRSSSDQSQIELTPMNIGATLSAMRELVLVTKNPEIIQRYKRYWSQAANSSGLQQSEYEETGEIDLTKSDGDGDGVPRMELAAGKYGIAPVFATKVVVAPH